MMKVLLEPKVEVINYMPNVLETIEIGARNCYKSENLIKEGSAEKIFNTIVKQRHHGSVAEHSCITVRIITDRAVMAQITRHRIGFSYSIESQRYNSYVKNKFNNEITVIKPFDIEYGSDAFHVWQSAMQLAETHYQMLIKEGCKPETARSVLPNSTKTEIVMTGNVRSWREFFKLRTSSHAQSDIQVVAHKIHEAMLNAGIPECVFNDIMEE